MVDLFGNLPLDIAPPGIQSLESLTLEVLGLPAPQGSKRPRPIYRGPREARVFTGHVAMVEELKESVRDWRGDIRAASIPHAGRFPKGVPLRIEIHFSMPRPASAPKTRRTWPVGARNDVDKLARSTLDALTSAGVIADDGQVVSLRAEKDYAGYGDGPPHPGAWITISVVSHPTH